MTKLFTIILFTILLSSAVMAQVDFSQDEIFQDLNTPNKLVVIDINVAFCKNQEVMAAINAFLDAQDIQQAQNLYINELCFSTSSMTTVWQIKEDLVNNLIQFRVLPPTIVKQGRDTLNWWVGKKYTVPYSEFVKKVQDSLLQLQKGLNKMYNQVEDREA